MRHQVRKNHKFRAKVDVGVNITDKIKAFFLHCYFNRTAFIKAFMISVSWPPQACKVREQSTNGSFWSHSVWENKWPTDMVLGKKSKRRDSLNGKVFFFQLRKIFLKNKCQIHRIGLRITLLNTEWRRLEQFGVDEVKWSTLSLKSNRSELNKRVDSMKNKVVISSFRPCP